MSYMGERYSSSRALIVLVVISVLLPHDAGWFDAYRDLDEVNAYLERIAALHPEVARVRELGRSAEGRPIRALELSAGAPATIVIDGGIHAREWISVMVATCLADRLADDPLLAQVGFTIVPVVNPDGYAYTWTTDRTWRKTRRDGHGVDLNRNFPIGWGGADSSHDPSSPQYRGAYPLSEPESRALAAAFDGRTRAHLDLHSFSQVIVYPWHHRREPTPDAERFAATADAMAAALRATHGETYRVRAGSELRVGAGGTVTDWSYAEHGALAFLLELRPARGPDGFELPPEQIAPTCDETLAAVRALAAAIIR
jgi:predicted deacylase